MTMKQTILPLILGLTALLVSAPMAVAQPVDKPLPPKLARAIAAFDAHQDHDARFAFTRATYRDNAMTEEKSFDPSRPRAQMWHILFPTEKSDPNGYDQLERKYAKTEGYSDRELILPDLRARLAEGAKFLRKEDGADVYGFKVANTYILEGGGREKDIHEDLLGEIGIDVNSDRILWIKYYAPQPFKPLSIVKINKYEIVQHLAPAWKGGPLVRVYETSKVDGHAPFTHIRVDEVMVNKDFQPRPKLDKMLTQTAKPAGSVGQ